jgi:hypothetical protein
MKLAALLELEQPDRIGRHSPEGLRSGMRFVCLAVLIVSPLSVYASAINVDLGTAASFAVMAETVVSSIGSSVIDGNVGGAIYGFPPGILVPPSTDYAGGSPVEAQAETDLITAYNFAASEVCSAGLPIAISGTYTPGVYCVGNNGPPEQLFGTLTLDNQGNPDAVFVFEIENSLNVYNDTSVVFAGGSQANVYWQVGGSVTVGAGTSFVGNILASQFITLGTGANIVCGSALSPYDLVLLDTNQVSVGCGTEGSPSPNPEPSTAVMLLLLGASALLWLRKPRLDRE